MRFLQRCAGLLKSEQRLLYPVKPFHCFADRKGVMLWDVAGRTKPKRVWIYVGGEDEARIDALLKKYPHLSEAAVMATLLSAALRACERENFAALPYEFSIVDKLRAEPATNRPEKTK